MDTRSLTALSSALLMLGGSAPLAAAGDPALTAARDRNPSLKAYSFQVDVAIRMQTFPWLRFHMDGTGEYVRGSRYVVSFTRMPFFAKGAPKTVDLSALDPTMWHKQFFVRLIRRQDGTKTFDLRERNVDPKESNPLVGAEVTLDANDATRDVMLNYKNGQIQLTVDPSETQGYRLPTSSEVNIRMPGQTLTAHADFSNYSILETTRMASNPTACANSCR